MGITIYLSYWVIQNDCGQVWQLRTKIYNNNNNNNNNVYLPNSSGRTNYRAKMTKKKKK
jgi:hypothetical protein